MYCVQPTGPVPTAVDWYNPQGQLVSRSGGDEVNQAGAGGRATLLHFQSYQHSQGGKYECRVTGPGDNLEKLPVCIGECYILGGYILCTRILFHWPQTAQVSTRCAHSVGLAEHHLNGLGLGC